MKILITGSNGMLGSDLVDVLSPQYEVAGLGLNSNLHPSIPYFKADIASSAEVLKTVHSFKPAIIIHCAAYTNVDGCERDPNQAYSINTRGTQYLAEASDQVGATIFFISSDYVFDGTKNGPYLESDKGNPVSVYGRSKFEAEEWLKSNCRSASIIRSSWLYGKTGRNFFRAILQCLKDQKELKVVQDQKGAPTYSKDLAAGLKLFLERSSRPKGCEIYHLANQGSVSWYEVAQELLREAKVTKEIKPITSSELNRAAKRPANSVFDMSKMKTKYNIKLRSWKEAFHDYWNEVLKFEWQEMGSKSNVNL